MPTGDENLIWCSANTESLVSARLTQASTKVLSFPSALPVSEIDSLYMNMYQPHGYPPSSNSRCAIWGTRKDDTNTWHSVLVFQNFKMAMIYERNLRSPDHCLPGYSQEQLSHWIDVIRPIYKLGINESRLIIRDGMREIDRIVRSFISLKPVFR